MICTIIQPSFLPWRGTFDLLKQADIYVVFDNVQYDKRGWRNRNIIKTQQGEKWLTVPVLTKGKYHQSVKDTRIDNTQNWQKKIINTVSNAYAKAPYFHMSEVIFSILAKRFEFLIDLNMDLLQSIISLLDIDVNITFSSLFDVKSPNKIEKLINICKAVGANHYISGPTARNYIEDDVLFRKNNLVLEFKTYDYLPYPQLHGEFAPNVSIIDLLFNVGNEKAGDYIWKTNIR